MLADALNRQRGPALAPAYWKARRVNGSTLEQSYRNSVYCCEVLRQEAGKISGQYCGNRWCLVCASIRTGRAWNNYMPVMKSWRDKQFLTLTIKNVNGAQLRGTIAEMLFALTWIKKEILRRYGIKLVGLRKLECTFNSETGEYHPHFHLVLMDAPMARLVKSMWLDVWGKEIANPAAQKMKPADNNSAGELFKYFTKLVTKRRMMAPPALDTIFRAMKGRRVFQPFGFTIPKDDDESGPITFEKGTQAPSRRDEIIVWDWMPSLHDWIDMETGDCLSGYEPTEDFRAFVESVAPAPGA